MATPKTPFRKVTFTEWALLQNGRISTMYFGRTSLRVTGSGEEKRFTMQKPGGEHSLLCLATDVDRLNAHLKNFVAPAA